MSKTIKKERKTKNEQKKPFNLTVLKRGIRNTKQKKKLRKSAKKPNNVLIDLSGIRSHVEKFQNNFFFVIFFCCVACQQKTIFVYSLYFYCNLILIPFAPSTNGRVTVASIFLTSLTKKYYFTFFFSFWGGKPPFLLIFFSQPFSFPRAPSKYEHGMF